jgi:hypothetical protein
MKIKIKLNVGNLFQKFWTISLDKLEGINHSQNKMKHLKIRKIKWKKYLQIKIISTS